MIEYEYHEAENFNSSLAELYHIVTMLRSPEGCPWDKEQTNKSIVQSLLGEIYEYLDTLEDADNEESAEEIGDVMMNVLMLLEIHEQNHDFKPVDSINHTCEKLVRRHPHVFSKKSGEEKTIQNSDQVITLWNDIKKNVEGRKDHQDDDFFSKIPRSTPNLEQAYQVQKKVGKVGFDWKDPTGVYDKVIEELEEVRKAENEDERQMEIGDLIFSVINLARFYKIHPDIALHRSLNKFKDRFNKMMKILNGRHIELSTENVDVMNQVWEEIKKDEK